MAVSSCDSLDKHIFSIKKDSALTLAHVPLVGNAWPFASLLPR